MDHTHARDVQNGPMDFNQQTDFAQPYEESNAIGLASYNHQPYPQHDYEYAVEALVKEESIWPWAAGDEEQKQTSGMNLFPGPATQANRDTHNQPFLPSGVLGIDLGSNPTAHSATPNTRPQLPPRNRPIHAHASVTDMQDTWQRELYGMLEMLLRQALQRLGANAGMQEQAVDRSRQFYQCVQDWLDQSRRGQFLSGFSSGENSRPPSFAPSSQSFTSFANGSFTSMSQSSQMAGDRDSGIGIRVGDHAQGKREYACTCSVCPWTSTTPYEWKRHEANHHRPWICMPIGSHVVGDHCAICGARDTSDRHRRTHPKLDACVMKQISDRSFRGIDKLMDHLKSHLSPCVDAKLPHANQVKRRELLNSWYDTPQLPLTALWCGFCQTYCPNWDERQEHVLSHIKDGRLKVEWMTEREDGNKMEI